MLGAAQIDLRQIDAAQITVEGERYSPHDLQLVGQDAPPASARK